MAMASEGYLADESERRRVLLDGKPRRPCGTYAAFQRHKKRGEQPCDACSEAAVRWQRFTSIRARLDRRRNASAPEAELLALGEEKVRRELEYRSLERLSDTPVPASHRWSVYRFIFDTGHGYVGITERNVSARAAEHLSGDARLTGGSARISELVAAGVRYKLKVIARELAEGQARALERKEIAKLDKPLNVQGPIRRGQAPH